MRALQLHDNRALAPADLPPPGPPAPAEVQVRIAAVALNHIDVWGWRGMAFAKRRLPIVVGAEAAGGAGFSRGLGFVAIILASVNIFGGFLVTQRMLAMYKKKER